MKPTLICFLSVWSCGRQKNKSQFFVSYKQPQSVLLEMILHGALILQKQDKHEDAATSQTGLRTAPETWQRASGIHLASNCPRSKSDLSLNVPETLWSVKCRWHERGYFVWNNVVGGTGVGQTTVWIPRDPGFPTVPTISVIHLVCQWFLCSVSTYQYNK